MHPIQPGVTGWLLFFCLILAVVYPATSFYHIVRQTVPRLIGEHNHAFIFLLSVYNVVFTALGVFSLISGLKLWLVKPEAVRFARSWLWTYLYANFAYLLLWLVIAKPHQSALVAEMGWYHAVGPIGSFALWYLYLEHSKRVQATFPSR